MNEPGVLQIVSENLVADSLFVEEIVKKSLEWNAEDKGGVLTVEPDSGKVFAFPISALTRLSASFISIIGGTLQEAGYDSLTDDEREGILNMVATATFLSSFPMAFAGNLHILKKIFHPEIVNSMEAILLQQELSPQDAVAAVVRALDMKEGGHHE